MAKEKNWKRARCLRQAKAWCPELFGSVCDSTYRRWTLEEKELAIVGRTRALSVAQEQRLARTAHELVKNGVPFTVEMFQHTATDVVGRKLS